MLKLLSWIRCFDGWRFEGRWNHSVKYSWAISLWDGVFLLSSIVPWFFFLIFYLVIGL